MSEAQIMDRRSRRQLRRAAAAAGTAAPPPGRPGRKPGSGKKDEAAKYSEVLLVKLTPGGKAQLSAQCAAAGFGSVSEYVRWMATRDRERVRRMPEDGKPVALPLTY